MQGVVLTIFALLVVIMAIVGYLYLNGVFDKKKDIWKKELKYKDHNITFEIEPYSISEDMIYVTSYINNKYWDSTAIYYHRLEEYINNQIDILKGQVDFKIKNEIAKSALHTFLTKNDFK